MSLSARAIAVQGIGFGPLLTAAQGLLDVPETSSGGIWKKRNELRRFLAEQRALDEAKRAEIAARAALEALANETEAENARAEAIRRVRETAAAHRRLAAEVAKARKALDADTPLPRTAITADAAVTPLQNALQTALAPIGEQIELIPTVEAPEARRNRRNRQRAAILAALLLLDD